MVFYQEYAYILILLSIPLQYNIFTDASYRIFPHLKNEWINKIEITHTIEYLEEKLPFYFGSASSIVFIFIYYRTQKIRLIISILFFCSGITWLLYLLLDENKIYLLFIIRSLQGIYMGSLQIIHSSYIMYFASEQKKCFCGCLTQISMFTGLFIENLLYSFLNWKSVVIVLFIESACFGCLIWLVPEIKIKTEYTIKESIFSSSNLKLLLVSIMLMILQLMSGIGIVLNQLPRMLSGIGINISSPLQSCLFDFVGGLATMIAALVTDIIGTKFMWVFSAFGICIALLINALTLEFNIAQWVTTLTVFSYFLFYGLGEGPIAWYFFSTSFSSDVRLESTAIITFVNTFLPQILDLVWKALDAYAGQIGSIIFCSCECFVGLLFGAIFIPQENYNRVDNSNIL